MKFFRKLNSVYSFLILLCLGGIVILLYIFTITWLENKIESQLASIHAKTSSVQVNLLSRSVHLTDFELYPDDSTAYSIQLKALSVSGISFYQLIAEKSISVREVMADSGKIIYYTSVKKDSVKVSNRNFRGLSIENLVLHQVVGEVQHDTVTEFSSLMNATLSGVTLAFRPVIMFGIAGIDGLFEKINITKHSGMYRLTIQALRYNSHQKEIVIDSTLLIPKYSKYEFAHRKGEQVGRINLAVPKIRVEGFTFEQKGDTSIAVTRLEINSFDLYSFKDKRVPFLRDFTIPLPMESFSKLRHMVSVDSLLVTDSRVTIEEISERGTEGGIVKIEHINAGCGPFSNRYTKGQPKFAELKASGLLMNSGEIKATFSLPLDGSPTYYTVGRITNLPFEKLNPALENLARFKVESGRLNNMRFNFHYTDTRSTGTMEIDYEDLRIIGLKKKSDDTSDIKTLFINAIIKDSKDKSLPKQKRTGTINIERDRKRYVFNVWWKSILDGLRSSILGIENNPTPKTSHQKSKK